jgi:hypothetical protein
LAFFVGCFATGIVLFCFVLAKGHAVTI